MVCVCRVRNPSQLTSPVVRQGGLGSLVSFLITMINVEQVLTVCQVLVRPGWGPHGKGQQSPIVLYLL